MRSRPSALSFALCLALAPVVMASSCGDKKNKDTDENGAGNGEGTGTGAGVESTLQVISIDPDRVEPGRQFQASLFGSGFAEGIEAYVGDTRIASVSRSDENTVSITVPPLETGAYDVRVRNPDGASHTLRGALIVRVGAGNDGDFGSGSGSDGSGGPTVPPGVNCDAITVAFDFDSYAINTLSMASLNNAVACFTAGSGSVRVEGHCDERGTTDYNLALGQKRAEAVQRWLTAQGVPPSRLRTVSFGEERPVDRGHSESAWARNRRVELRVSR